MPYVMPGFELACAVRETLADGSSRTASIGMVLLNHGLFTFGASSAEAYARHVELIDPMPRQWLDQERRRHPRPKPPASPTTAVDGPDLARAASRRVVGEPPAVPMVMQRDGSADVMEFVRRADLARSRHEGSAHP